MAYIAKNLSELYIPIGGSGQRTWQYWSADSIATITGSGYVSDAGNKRMQVGDIVFAFSGTLNTTGPDATPSTHARGTVSEFASQPTFAILQVASIATGAATLTASALSTDTLVNTTLTGTTTATGTVNVGGASDSVGFFGATAHAQPTNAAEAAITDNSGGTGAPTTGVVANAYKVVVVLPLQLVDIATGTFKVAVPFACTVLSALFRTAKPASTASKLATLTVTTNGATAVTGGVMALTTANQNTIGGTVAATAISGAAATIAAGQTIEVTASAVTAFVEGDGYVEFTVSNNDLANAAATQIALENQLRSALVTLGLIKGS